MALAGTPSCPRKRLPEPKCWSDVIKPIYKGEVEISHPASRRYGYAILARLVQLMGEDAAFEYMKALHKMSPNTPAVAPRKRLMWPKAK